MIICRYWTTIAIATGNGGTAPQRATVGNLPDTIGPQVRAGIVSSRKLDCFIVYFLLVMNAATFKWVSSLNLTGSVVGSPSRCRDRFHVTTCPSHAHHIRAISRHNAVDLLSEVTIQTRLQTVCFSRLA